MAVRTPVPVSVVEDHDEALVVIYRAMGSKRLPLSGICLIHFDAHPDLLSPNLPADEFCDKEKLFAYTSIADWILPAVYMGHIDCVVWLKPPWSSQMMDGEYRLVVGREVETGHIRVATPLAYFVSDQLYAPTDRLTDTRIIPLHVVTLPVLEPESQAGERLVEDGSSQRREESGTREVSSLELEGTCSRPAGETGITSDQRASLETSEETRDRNGPCIAGNRNELDSSRSAKTVEEEDTSTSVGEKTCGVGERGNHSSLVSECVEEEGMNPPVSKKSRLASPQPHPLPPSPILKHTPPPPPPSSLMSRAVSVVCGVLGVCDSWVLDVDLDFFSTANPFHKEFSHIIVTLVQEEYSFLERVYKFQDPSSNSQESVAESVLYREQQLDLLLGLWREEETLESDLLCDEDQGMISALKAKIGTMTDGTPIAPEDVHLAGMMTDLPHHTASESEIKGLMMAASLLLKASISSHTNPRPPALVTIARSTEDGYTPPTQVEQLQTAVVGVVQGLCGGCVQLHHCYLDPAYRTGSHDH